MGNGFAAVLTAVFAAAAAGLAGAIAALERKSAPVPHLTAATALVFAALAALAASCMVQLGRPGLIFSAFSNPSSSIFRLGAAWLCAAVLCAAYLAATHRSAYESTCRLLALAAFAACVMVLAAHAVNYFMPWRAAWNTPAVILPYFGYAALAGAALYAFFGSFSETALSKKAALAAGGFAAAALALYLAAVGVTDSPEPIVSRVLSGDLAQDFWALAVAAGVLLPWAAVIFAPKNRAATAVAAVAAVIGCAGWQVVLLELGSSAWSFFAR